MTRLSYAQNFEDVLLHRSLSDVDVGFYIDVGANDPQMHSVTKRFYDLGWRGINIEPSNAYFEKLNLERPRDLNIRAVVSNRDGLARFFEIEGTGISTTEPDIAHVHQLHGYPSVEIEVEALTLATICQRHVEEPVHFLKIDVEGGTKSVLEGLDLQSIRPWIIVIEATKPQTQIEDSDEWEHLILSQNYEFVYADGLNKFYLAYEHSARRDKFKYPPNVFDDFMLATTREEMTLRQSFEAAARHAVDRVATLEQDRDQLVEVVRAQNAWGQVAEAKIDELTREKAGLEAALAIGRAQAQAMDACANGLEREAAALAQALAAQDARATFAEAQVASERAALQAAQEGHAQAAAAAGQLLREKSVLEASLARTGDRLQAALRRVSELEVLQRGLQNDLSAQTQRAQVNGARADHLETMLRRVAGSLSWRITAPLRGRAKGEGKPPSGA